MLTKAKRTIRLLWPEFKLPLQRHCKDYLFNFVYRGLVASWDKMVIRQCKAMGWAKETACDCRGCLLRSLNRQNICHGAHTAPDLCWALSVFYLSMPNDSRKCCGNKLRFTHWLLDTLRTPAQSNDIQNSSYFSNSAFLEYNFYKDEHFRTNLSMLRFLLNIKCMTNSIIICEAKCHDTTTNMNNDLKKKKKRC